MLTAACCDGAPKGAAKRSHLCATLGFPGDSVVKNLPAMQETGVQSLGQEDPPEKEMATHSSILENPMDRGTWWATVHGVAKSRTRLCRQAGWPVTHQTHRSLAHSTLQRTQ